MKKDMAKKIPYGLTDYVRVLTEDYYYVDKTRYIDDLEKTAAFLFLIRPRRFGKSLFLSMLYCYYDVRYADKFDELFGNQYIGKRAAMLGVPIYLLIDEYDNFTNTILSSEGNNVYHENMPPMKRYLPVPVIPVYVCRQPSIKAGNR